MALIDTKIRHIKPKDKAFKLFDEKGLYLLVTTKGSKCWRFKYRFGKKEKVLAIGLYPDISLAEARDRRDAARKQMANGIDPGVLKQTLKQAANSLLENSFEAVAREWFAKHSPRWVASSSRKVLGRLENDVFPWLGARPISEIKAPDLLAVLRRIESRGALEIAHRVHQYCGRIFRYGIAIGKCERDLAADLRGAIPPTQVQHRPAILEPNKLAELLKVMEGYQGYFVTKCALKTAPLVFVRPGELRHAEWSEINWDASEWNIPAQKMKMRQPHLVPLSKQVIAILQELYPLTGRGRYVFPGLRSATRPISDNTLLIGM